MDSEKIKIRISVRNLVEFILRSGDIDNRRGRTAVKEAMQEGSRMHRKIQRRMGADYHAEVPLKIELEKSRYLFVVEGRADGIIIRPDGVIIDEIKGMYLDVNGLEEPFSVHLAQAKCYAYIYALLHEEKKMGIQMTYANLDTEDIKQFPEVYTFEELEDFFLELVAEYEKWADFQYEWRLLRQASIKNLEFPFAYRKGQKKLAGDVYRTIAREKNLFIQAPTGVGKTISTVFPTVKAVGEGLVEKIFYLTAKTITATVAKDTFDLLKKGGYESKVVTITAKEKLCVCDEMDCNPVNCPYAKGHYDRINDAVFDLLNKEHDFSREKLLAQAEQFQVCPFELCLDAATWSDVIICDYNYVFDPNVYLKRFFAENTKENYVFLVDEAHNLVERGREMYSALLVKEDLLHMKKLIKNHSKKLEQLLNTCNKQMLEWKRECEKFEIYDNVGHFIFSLMRLAGELDLFLQQRPEFPEKKEVTDFYLNLRHFLNMYDLVDENYVIYTGFDEAGHFSVKLYCVNPAANLQRCLDKGRSAVFFSATLLPVQYYKNLLSTKEDNYAVYAETVFTPDQHLLAVGRDVSSLYTRRNEDEFARIAEYIYQTVSVKKGNYIVFFPSYRMMEQVYEAFLKRRLSHDSKQEGAVYAERDNIEVMIQTVSMTEHQRESFVEQFSEKRAGSLAAFCVLGGIFGEGIDLKGERLIGTIIVGTGLPQICDEREILKQYYDKKSGQGFAYAYLYPGMNKVLQAAGRVIRTADDKGVILLLDQRFLRRDYLELFPREWSDYEVCRAETISKTMHDFWNR